MQTYLEGNVWKEKSESVYKKCKNEGIMSSEQMYECACNDKQQSDSKLNSYDCAMLNDIE